MTVEVKLFENFDAVERDALGALDRLAQPSLFSRLSWFRMISEHCSPVGQLLVAKAQCDEDGPDISAVWIFLSNDNGNAEFLSSWYSLRTDVVHHLRSQAVTDRCLEALARSLRGHGLKSLVIPRLEHEPKELASSFAKAGWWVNAEPAVVNWQVETDGQDFDTYWARRPSRLRNTAQRKTRSAGLEVEIFRDFDENAWHDYETIYAASWKPEEGSPGFLRALAEQEGKAGTLRLGIARKDGQAIAAQFWLVENQTATIHKLAYREDMKQLSPGTVLSMAMFREILDKDRVSSIDYGTGDDAYKRDWMQERRLLWRFEAYNPSTISGLLAGLRSGGSKLVARLRSR